MSGQALSTALTPAFDTPVRTADGFTVNVTNYDANYTWTPSVSTGSISAGTASGSTLPLTVTGLSAGATASITMGTARTGYLTGSATASGQALGAQFVTWAPATTITPQQSPYAPGTATALGGAAITYAVVPGHTTTTCAVHISTGELTYTGTGTCTIRATAAATSAYAEGRTDVTFSVALTSQNITAHAVSTRLQIGESTTLSTSGSIGTGTVTWSIANGTCSINGTTLIALSAGSCTASATIAADALYMSATDTVEILVDAPPSPVNTSPEQSDPAPSASSSLVPQSGNADPAGPIPTSPPRDTSDTGLPPSPTRFQVDRDNGARAASVVVPLPNGAAGTSITAVFVAIHDARGEVVRRIKVPVSAGSTQVTITLRRLRTGESVSVYNANEAGVSSDADPAASVLHEPTTSQTIDGARTLVGQRIGRPITFGTGSARLDADDRRTLRTVARYALDHGAQLFITGFAGKSEGSTREMTATSTARAQAVSNELARLGVRVWMHYWGAGGRLVDGSGGQRAVEIRTDAP